MSQISSKVNKKFKTCFYKLNGDKNKEYKNF